MGQYKWIAAIGWLCLAAGCDEPPLGPPDMASGDVDRGVMDLGVIDQMVDMRIVDAVVDMSNCPPPTFTPDIAEYTANIAGPLFNACALCHPANDPAAPTFNLSGMAADDARESASFVSIRCLADPATCDIVAWHPEGHPGYVQEPLRSALVDWVTLGAMIEACVDDPAPGDGGMGPAPDMGPPPVPCEALPQPGDNIASSAQFRSEFEAPDGEGISHNDILVGSCARNGACHAIAGEGDGYFLLEGNDECSIDWNFFVSQIYIDFLSPARSPLLTLPRDNSGHGGRSVFQGADDSRHVRLQRWIENETARRPR